MLSTKNMKEEKEGNIVPHYIYILSIIGIIFLTFSLITWFVYYFHYLQSYNNSIDEKSNKEGHDIFLGLTSALFVVGFLMSSVIFLGLYKAQKHYRNSCQ